MALRHGIWPTRVDTAAPDMRHVATGGPCSLIFYERHEHSLFPSVPRARRCDTRKMTPEEFNELATGHLPETLGIVATHIGTAEAHCELRVRKSVMAPNGYIHAGSVVSLADTTAGYGCIANLPDHAKGFTTVELKTNHIGTALEGVIKCVATLVHAGKTTQVWDAIVTHVGTNKTLALFRCTQMIIYERNAQRESADQTRRLR